VSFAAIILCVASQEECLFISLSTQSENFWIYPRIHATEKMFQVKCVDMKHVYILSQTQISY
jgi:hypothetical protein